jgi:putative phosphoesterase
MLLFILSDTHALLRPELLAALTTHAPDHILHVGDIGDPAILSTLRRIAPTTAIRGNIDTSGPCAQLPPTEVLDLDGTLIYMLHSLSWIDINPAAAGISVVLHGHSHQPSIATRDGVLYLNPGSCGPRRFNLPITFALLHLDAAIPGGHPTAEIVHLTVSARA